MTLHFSEGRNGPGKLGESRNKYNIPSITRVYEEIIEMFKLPLGNNSCTKMNKKQQYY
jgi:hypothetical protein